MRTCTGEHGDEVEEDCEVAGLFRALLCRRDRDVREPILIQSCPGGHIDEGENRSDRLVRLDAPGLPGSGFMEGEDLVSESKEVVIGHGGAHHE
jgi:hypothetical protein